MNIQDLAIDGLKAVVTNAFRDERGAFARFFCDQELALVIGNRQIVQINYSTTAAVGAVRGMHYQAPVC